MMCHPRLGAGNGKAKEGSKEGDEREQGERCKRKNVGAISEVLRPFDARLMRSYPVSSRINHVVNDDEECSRPVESEHSQDRLF